MAKYIKGKDGKFAGSIGDGKTNVPTAAPRLTATAASQSTMSDLGASTDWSDLEARFKAQQEEESPGYTEYEKTAIPIPRYSASQHEIWHTKELVPEIYFRARYRTYDPTKTTMVGNKWSTQSLGDGRYVGAIDLQPARDTNLAPGSLYFTIPAFDDYRDTQYLADLNRDPRTGYATLAKPLMVKATPRLDGTYDMAVGTWHVDQATGIADIAPVSNADLEYRFVHTVGRKANGGNPPSTAAFRLSISKHTGTPFSIEYDTTA